MHSYQNQNSWCALSWKVLGRHLALGMIDFAISAELPTQTRSIRSQKLLSAHFVSVLRADHPSARGRLTLKKFLALRHVVVDHPGLADAAIDAALTAAHLERRIAITLANPDPIPTLLAHSDFIATLPRMMLDVGPSPADLKIFPPPMQLEPVTIYLISHERTGASPAHLWMSEAIVQTFRQLPSPAR